MQETRHETPLQARLDRLGIQIGYGGMVVGALLTIILILAYLIRDGDNFSGNHFVEILIDAVIAGVIIVVVAVPEGLPLAVTISLAYSMRTMLVDNNFVRHLSACETMGNATTICSDKTGTLTQNKMSVEKAYFCNNFWYDSSKGDTKLSDKLRKLIVNSQIINSKAFYEEEKDNRNDGDGNAGGGQKRGIKKLVGGNQTECALLQWAIDLGGENYKEIRKSNPVTEYFPFDSSVKRSSVLLHNKTESGGENKSDCYVVYTKGAAEQILALCSRAVTSDDNDNNVELTEDLRNKIVNSMGKMTRKGLRCIGLCYKEFDKEESEGIDVHLKRQKNNAGSGSDEKEKHDKNDKNDEKKNDNDNDDDNSMDHMLFSNMVWIGLAGIKDPVRREVPDAVRACQNAGIIVRMVTGDHLETAKHIAKECNILSCPEHICMEGFEFRHLTDAEKLEKLPYLRVLARSKPQDKENLVKWYMGHGDVVAVTGDGANDALALKEANIGLSMGIQGTDVAKEASDIVIMDDNFKSIEKTGMLPLIFCNSPFIIFILLFGFFSFFVV